MQGLTGGGRSVQQWAMPTRQKEAKGLVAGQIGHCDRQESYMRVLHFKIESALQDRNNTGVKKFSLGYLLKPLRHVRSRSKFWRLLQRTQQTALFLERFQCDLDPGIAADLRRYAHMAPHTNIMERIHIVYLRHFTRHGWIRNLALAVRLAIG